MNNIEKGPTFSPILIIFLSLFLFVSTPAKAESVQEWIANLGQVRFNQAGGAFLPTGVLSSMRRGRTSTIQDFIILNHTVNECIENTLSKKNVPGQRDPYLVAAKKFNNGVCLLKKCWQNGMLIQLVPLISESEENGENTDQLAVLMAQAFQKDPGCDGTKGGGFDQNLLNILTK